MSEEIYRFKDLIAKPIEIEEKKSEKSIEVKPIKLKKKVKSKQEKLITLNYKGIAESITQDDLWFINRIIFHGQKSGLERTSKSEIIPIMKKIFQEL